MNCHNCEQKVRTPRSEYTVAELIERLRPYCLRCNPAEMPRGGYSQVEATEATVARRIVQHQTDDDDMCAGVSADAFDRFRIAITTLFALDPMDLLIVQCLLNGGSYGDFSQIYATLVEKCKRYHGGVRQMIYARKKRIEAQIPMLKPIFAAIVAKAAKDRRGTIED